MRFKVKMDDFQRELDRAFDDAEHSVSDAMEEVQVGLKDDLREQVLAARLGVRLSKTWRGRRYPEGRPSLNSAAYVWSRAPNIVDAFERGVPIVARNKKYLAIPTPDAGVRHTTVKNKRITPKIWETETGVKLRFVKIRGRAFLVADAYYRRQPARYRRRKTFAPIREPVRLPGGRRFVVIFILAPMVRPGKRLDIESVGNRWADRVPGLIAKHWR